MLLSGSDGIGKAWKSDQREWEGARAEPRGDATELASLPAEGVNQLLGRHWLR